jgi:hypothetical protein
VAVFETWSQRKRRASGKPDVYQYETVPPPLRVQLRQILADTLGEPSGYDEMSGESSTNPLWDLTRKTLIREFGRVSLSNQLDGFGDVSPFILSCTTDEFLDVVEVAFWVSEKHEADQPYANSTRAAQFRIQTSTDDARSELNHRFKEHGVGYELVGHQIVRVDSQLIHAEAVVPALRLLMEHGFEGAEDEFRKAHEHLRHGQTKEAADAAVKAFESTMKTICTERKWPYKESDTSKVLLDILISNGLIPSQMQSYFSGLRSALESGLPTLGNTITRHGQGPKVRNVPDAIGSFALHLCASSIVFLIEMHRATP